jgi:L-amino acid N-acyltransferase YncA
MHLTFTYAVEGDLERIVTTYNQTVPGRMVTADLEPVSVESKRDWFKAHNQKNRPLWIVMADGEYAGWMSFNSFYGRPAYSITAEVSIYLEETMRGKGIGEACLKHALIESPQRGIENLLGFIFGHNVPSLKLFYKYGFEKWAHFPGVALMDGLHRDLLILGKKL